MPIPSFCSIQPVHFVSWLVYVVAVSMGINIKIDK